MYFLINLTASSNPSIWLKVVPNDFVDWILRTSSYLVKKKRSFGNKVFEKPTTVKEDVQAREIKAEANELFKKKEEKVSTEEVFSEMPIKKVENTVTDPIKEFTEEEILACSIDNPDDCEACGS